MLLTIIHVLNEQGTGYEFFKSIGLKNGANHLKGHPKVSKYTKFEIVIGLNVKVWFTFKNHYNKRT